MKIKTTLTLSCAALLSLSGTAPLFAADPYSAFNTDPKDGFRDPGAAKNAFADSQPILPGKGGAVTVEAIAPAVPGQGPKINAVIKEGSEGIKSLLGDDSAQLLPGTRNILNQWAAGDAGPSKAQAALADSIKTPGVKG